MAREVVHHHDITGMQRRAQTLTRISQERGAVHGPVEHDRCLLDHAVETDRAEHRHGFPMTLWRVIHTTLADWRPAVQPRHVRLGPGFIEEYEAVDIGEPSGDRKVMTTTDHVGTILFRGDQRLLLSDSPRRLSARHTVDSTTCTLSIGISCLAVIPGCAATV